MLTVFDSENIFRNRKTRNSSSESVNEGSPESEKKPPKWSPCHLLGNLVNLSLRKIFRLR